MSKDVLVTQFGHAFHAWYLNYRGEALTYCLSIAGIITPITEAKAIGLKQCERCFHGKGEL